MLFLENVRIIDQPYFITCLCIAISLIGIFNFLSYDIVEFIVENFQEALDLGKNYAFQGTLLFLFTFLFSICGFF